MTEAVSTEEAPTALAVATYFDEMNDTADAVSHDALDSLMRRYKERKDKLCAMSTFMNHNGETGLISMFLRGNIKDRHALSLTERELQRMFSSEGATKALDAQFWQEALSLTNILSLLPAKRRNEWNEQIYNMETPPFNNSNLRATLNELFARRKDYFAERVDGIFCALSHTHVTNRPEGFSKRLITYVYRRDPFFLPSDVAYIDDLRYVIAVMMRRETPRQGVEGSLYGLLDWITRNGEQGEWFDVDGGVFRLKVFKKGTVHIEIHQSVAWQLNRVLAHIYPQAIPSQFRAPRKERKEVNVTPITKPLPKQIVAQLYELATSRVELVKTDVGDKYSLNLARLRVDKFVYRELCDALTAIGGDMSTDGSCLLSFHPDEVLMEIVYSGCLPDARSHQFYPTPALLAEHAADLLDVKNSDRILEPSAGIGGLADYLPVSQTTCVEYAPVHCEILRSKGFSQVECADFLEWSTQYVGSFEKILMNPPFTSRQAEAHLDSALSCLSPGGRLVAVLPSGLAKRWKPCPSEKAAVTWEPTMHDAFPGVGVSITIAVVTK